MFYTYSHATPEGRIFYIGKGQGKRAYNLKKRNEHWHRIVEKYGSPTIEVLANWDTEEEAFSHEVLLIKCFKGMGYSLANHTNGGEGQSGMTPWNKGIPWKKEIKFKMSKGRIGFPAWNKGIPLTDECKQKISQALIGKAAWNIGIPLKEETKQKLSMAGLGNKRALGHKVSEASKKLMGLANIGRPTSAKQKEAARKIFIGNNYAAGNTAQRKWVWVGTNVITGEVVKFIGEKEMKAAGIQHSNVIKCLNGQRKSHKGYTWHRELWENKSWH